MPLERRLWRPIESLCQRKTADGPEKGLANPWSRKKITKRSTLAGKQMNALDSIIAFSIAGVPIWVWVYIAILLGIQYYQISNYRMSFRDEEMVVGTATSATAMVATVFGGGAIVLRLMFGWKPLMWFTGIGAAACLIMLLVLKKCPVTIKNTEGLCFVFPTIGFALQFLFVFFSSVDV